MSTLTKIEEAQVAKLKETAKLPEFRPGDTVKVNVKVVEGDRERVQAFEGVCISRKNAGINSAFTVRKISYGEGVERVFPLFSPRIDSIEVTRRGSVRRAKLYYLRKLRGKSARITELAGVHGLEGEEGAEGAPKAEKGAKKKLPQAEGAEAAPAKAKAKPAAAKKKPEGEAKKAAKK